MKISTNWLKELINLNITQAELIRLFPLRTIGTKEITDNFFELDMKGYNRADLLYLRGIAREVAAITNSPLKFKPLETGFPKDLPQTPVVIEDEELSPVQCVIKIEGLRVEKSPSEWIEKLADSGVRPINNIADITNLVMLEYGHPLHAFDAATVKGETINVRRAKEGEKVITLDGKVRKLTPEDIVLSDTEKALDVAGIMGSKETEVSESTTSILLSASLFNPTSIRKTASRLMLHSEASRRFQHGLNKTNLLQSLAAAIKMYKDLGGKLTALTLTGDLKDEPKIIKLTQEKVNSLIGIKIPPVKVESSLKKLGFTLASQEDLWEATVPYWRLDINIEEDLIEEVARVYGYENIPPKELGGEIPAKVNQEQFILIEDAKNKLAALGLTEVQTYSFYSSEVLENMGYAKDSNLRSLVKIANPISSETEYLKDNLWPNLVEVVSKNIKKGYADIAIFEIGKVYLKQEGQAPKEEYRLALTLMNGADNPIQELYALLKKMELDVNLAEGIKGNAQELFHPTRQRQIELDSKNIGIIAEVHPRILNKLGIKQRVAVAEINLEPIITKRPSLR